MIVPKIRLTVDEMWEEYRRQRLSTESGVRQAERVFTSEWGVDLSASVILYDDVFQVMSVAWTVRRERGGWPSWAGRENWLLCGSTKKCLDAFIEKGFQALLVLYNTPDWVPRFAVEYRPDTTILQRAGRYGIKHAVRPLDLSPSEVVVLEPAPWSRVEEEVVS